jgi:hypothetical protein
VTEFSIPTNGSGTWVTVGATTPIEPAYPAATTDGLAANDIVYLLVSAKRAAAGVPVTITPTGSWTQVGTTLTGGGGTDAGSSTGPTEFGVWKRSIPGGFGGGDTDVALAGNNVAQAVMVVFRPDSGSAVTWTEEVESFSTGSTPSSSLSFTASAAPAMGIADDDHIVVALISPDDGSTPQMTAAPTVAASGATIGAVTTLSDVVTSTNNDLSSYVGDCEVTAGSSSSAPTLTGTAGSSETRQAIWLIVRASGGTATNASAGSASIGLAAQTAAANYSSSPTIGSAAVTLSGQDATVATSISRTPTTATISMAAEQPTTSSSLTRTAGFATPTMSAEQPTVTVQTNVSAATFGMAAHDGLVSSVTTQAPAGVAALGLAAQGATTTIQTGSGSASIGLAAQPGVVLGGATTAPGLASFSLTARDPSVSVMASAGLASIGFVAQDVINSDQSIACAFFETVVVVDSHEAFVGVEEHIGSVVLDAHSGSVEVDAHYATAEICGRS